MAAPFEWGVSDCSMFADIVKELTGFDPIADVRGYTSELSALRNLRAAGYTSTLSLVEDLFPEIDPALAGRGDLAFPKEIAHPLMSPAVIDGVFAYSKSLTGGVMLPRAEIARAFAI